jgi:hypothetical protein
MRNAYDLGETFLENLLLEIQRGQPTAHVFGTEEALWAKEVLFEAVRESDFPDLAGRFESCFIWDDMRWALEMFGHRKRSNPNTVIWECSTTADQGYRRFDLLEWQRVQLDLKKPILPLFEQVRESARRYYSQTPTESPIWEILAIDEVKIERLLVS